MTDTKHNPEVAALIERTTTLTEEEAGKLASEWPKQFRDIALMRIVDLRSSAVTAATVDAFHAFNKRNKRALSAIIAAAGALAARSQLSNKEFRLLHDPWFTVIGETHTQPPMDDSDWVTQFNKRR